MRIYAGRKERMEKKVTGDVRLKQFSMNDRVRFCKITRTSIVRLSSLPSSSTFFSFGALCFFVRTMSSTAPESLVSAACQCRM